MMWGKLLNTYKGRKLMGMHIEEIRDSVEITYIHH